MRSNIFKCKTGGSKNVRQYLGAFGLGGAHAKRLVGSLSGGERMRLCFATVMAESPHLLCLYEPSNHVDMETLDALAAALDSFPDVVATSHNESFLCGFCKELLVVVGGRVYKLDTTTALPPCFRSTRVNQSQVLWIEEVPEWPKPNGQES